MVRRERTKVWFDNPSVDIGIERLIYNKKFPLRAVLSSREQTEISTQSSILAASSLLPSPPPSLPSINPKNHAINLEISLGDKHISSIPYRSIQSNRNQDESCKRCRCPPRDGMLGLQQPACETTSHAVRGKLFTSCSREV